MVSRFAVPILLASLLVGCVSPLPPTPLLNVPRTIPTSESELRLTLAKMVMRAVYFRWIHDPQSKLIRATITRPKERKPLFSNESYIDYCVDADFEREGWPLPLVVGATFSVYGSGTDRMRIKMVRGGGCSFSNPEPFREFEELYRSLPRMAT